MTSTLTLCGACFRHFRLHEPVCPFCGASVINAARPRPPAIRLPAGASRSRRYAAGAALLTGSAMVACGGDSTAESTQTGGVTGVDGSAAGAGGSDSSGGRGGVLGGGSGGIRTGGTGGIGGIGGIGGTGTGGGLPDLGRTCEGATTPTGTLCRTSDECSGFANCVIAVPPGPSCGNPTFLPQDCVVHADCGTGSVCITTECGGHLCMAACTDGSCPETQSCIDGQCVLKRCDETGAAPCAAGFECDPSAVGASAVGCVPVHCSSGMACADGYDCVATAPGNGCVHRACTTDNDCECGYCVNAYCEATLGFCYEIVAMPYGCVWPDEELV